MPTATTDPYWGTLYKTIFYANSVLDDFEKRIPAEAEKELYEIVKGEAYALRAYAYFYLINLYAENYAPENMDKPGVPMPLTAEDVQTTSQNNVREPVKVVWEQINQDLDNATTLLSGKWLNPIIGLITPHCKLLKLGSTYLWESGRKPSVLLQM